jgi:hypothetical protein
LRSLNNHTIGPSAWFSLRHDPRVNRLQNG